MKSVKKIATLVLYMILKGKGFFNSQSNIVCIKHHLASFYLFLLLLSILTRKECKAM